jgi:hypothetical protein
MYHTIYPRGNLGKDPEMRYTPSGQSVTNFSVASNRSYTGSDGKKVDETTWFRVTVWGKQASLLRTTCTGLESPGRGSPDSWRKRWATHLGRERWSAERLIRGDRLYRTQTVE